VKEVLVHQTTHKVVFILLLPLSGIRDVNAAYNAVNGNNLPTSAGNTPYQDGEHFIFNRKAKRLNTTEYTFNPQLGIFLLIKD
jgi:hypothetical protein